MRSRLKLRWPLLGAAAAALATASIGGASHSGVFANHVNEGGCSLSTVSFEDACLAITNTAVDTSSSAVVGIHQSATGVGPAVAGFSNSTSATGSAVHGRMTAANSGAVSAGVRGINDGAGFAVRGLAQTGTGVSGVHQAGAGTAAGVAGETNAPLGGVGVRGEVLPTNAGLLSTGVRGINNGTGSLGYGVYGSHAGSGPGVYGYSPTGNGVRGLSDTEIGVFGKHDNATGTQPGVHGETDSSAADAVGTRGVITSVSAAIGSAGVKGINNSTIAGAGVLGQHVGPGAGVEGVSSGGDGVVGQTLSALGSSYGVEGRATSATPAANAAGVHGRVDNPATSNGFGVLGTHGGFGPGVFGESRGIGVVGRHAASTGTEPGVRGETISTSDLAAGVYGEALGAGTLVAGVYGNAASGVGVLGIGNTAGVLGYNPAGLAGLFVGNLAVSGTLTKGAGAFRIDHPLDPKTKYLQHSFVESPDMKNVYDGVVRTDRRGYATVRLPRYFQALNRDFRYQLTILGKAGWDVEARIWDEIARNRFTIRTNRPGIKVSWQVTGIRKDSYANANRIEVEVAKSAAEPRGMTAAAARLAARKER